jgi:6,7-dimethyl-8-ribityllumazine synthase
MAGSGARGPAQPINAHLLVIEARYYEAIADLLLEGAKAEMAASGVTFDVVTVPGALEIPQALGAAAMSRLIPSTGEEPTTYDGAVALGCVVRGETSHYDVVVGQANHWLMHVATEAGIPVGNAILTVDTQAQAVARAEGGREGKGGDAVRACLALIRIARMFEAAAGEDV